MSEERPECLPLTNRLSVSPDNGRLNRRTRFLQVGDPSVIIEEDILAGQIAKYSDQRMKSIVPEVNGRKESLSLSVSIDPRDEEADADEAPAGRNVSMTEVRSHKKIYLCILLLIVEPCRLFR